MTDRTAPVDGATVPLTVTFDRERETKTTWRYQEQRAIADEPPLIGTLYVRKNALGMLGNPELLTVTIKGGTR
jgi:hypothetical protein